MKVRYSKRAIVDLTEIGDYLSNINPSLAATVEQKIRRDIDLLGDFPALGRPTMDHDIRMFPIVRYPYLVFYEILDEAVIIHHIRHAARRPIDPRDL